MFICDAQLNVTYLLVVVFSSHQIYWLFVHDTVARVSFVKAE